MEFTLWLGVTSALACYLPLLNWGIHALRRRERPRPGGGPPRRGRRLLRLLRGLLEFHRCTLVGFYVLLLLSLARLLPWHFAP